MTRATRLSNSLRQAIRAQLTRFAWDRGANVVVIACFGLPAVLVSAAAAISYSNEYSVKTNLQNAIDAAVLAGAVEIGAGDPIRRAELVFTANLNDTTRTYSSQFKTQFKIEKDVITGQVSGQVENVFAGVLGAPSYAVEVSSAASKTEVRVCVLGLNAFDSGAFDINGNPDFNASCAVQANSGSRSGMTQEGKANVRAAKFGVSGKQKTNAFSPLPEEGTRPVADPFATLPFPSSTSCDSATKSSALVIKTPMDIEPGTYCGGITVNGVNVTMKPGIYIMKDGSLLVQGGAAVTGRDVMIGFTGEDSTLRLWGNSSLTLTSPAQGVYKNIQFMVDPNSMLAQRAWVSIGGSNGNPDGTPKLTYDGVAYFAKQNFWAFGNAIINGNSPSLTVVADKIWVQGSATVNLTNDNRRGLDVAKGPVAGSTNVRLLR